MTRVVIIGGGFGGLCVAQELMGRKDIELTLINPSKHFLFTPLLHEVATGSLAPYSVTYNIPKLLGKRCVFIRDRAERVDLENKTITLERDKGLEFDYVVIATGATTNFYGNESAEKNSLTLKTLDDALTIRNRIDDKVRCMRGGKLSVIVVGGGATGIELAAEISQFIDECLEFNDSSSKIDVKLTIINARKRLLPREAPYFRNHATERLKHLGWEIKEDSKVVRVGKDFVELQDGKRIDADLIVWTAGIRPSEPEIIPGLPKNVCGGKIPISKTMQIAGHEHAFCIGDCAACPDSDGYVPALAQAAESEAKLCANNILRRIRGRQLKIFTWKNKGFLISLGKGYGIAEIAGVRFKGPLAWWVWRTVYLSKLPGGWNRLAVAWHWTAKLFEKRVY